MLAYKVEQHKTEKKGLGLKGKQSFKATLAYQDKYSALSVKNHANPAGSPYYCMKTICRFQSTYEAAILLFPMTGNGIPSTENKTTGVWGG